jgi:hypothetical protein
MTVPMLVLPVLTDTPRYSTRVTLDKVNYWYDLEWIDREAAWFLSLYADDRTPLVLGVRVVVNFPFLARYREPGFPPGILQALDTSGSDADPAYGDLGDSITPGRVQLVYFPAGALA